MRADVLVVVIAVLAAGACWKYERYRESEAADLSAGIGADITPASAGNGLERPTSYTQLAWSADGEGVFALGSSPGNALFHLDPDSGRASPMSHGIVGQVTAIESLASSRLLLGTGRGEVFHFSTEASPTKVASSPIAGQTVRRIRRHASGQTLILFDTVLVCLDAGFKTLWEYHSTSALSTVSQSTSGDRVLAATADGSLVLLHGASGKLVSNTRVAEERLLAELSPDGRRAYVVRPLILASYDLETGSGLWERHTEATTPLVLCVAPDGQSVFLGLAGTSAQLWSAEGVLYETSAESSLSTARYSATSAELAFGTQTGTTGLLSVPPPPPRRR